MEKREFPIRGFCLSIFGASWFYRFALALVSGAFHVAARKDLVRGALSLVHTGVLGNYCLTPTGPSALQPPGYVLVLAAIFQIFGTGVGAEIVKALLCITVSSLRCGLIPYLAYRFELGSRAVILSGVAAVLWIGALETELKGDWDAPITAVLLILLTYLHFSKPVVESSRLRVAGLGALWGVATLFNPVTLQVLVGIVVLEAVRAGRGRMLNFARHGALLGGCLLCVLFPWALRNRLALGEFVWTRDTMPFSLYISYRDAAHWADPVNTRPSLGHPDRPNRDDVESPCPWVNPSESQRMTKMGELGYLRDLNAKATSWIRTHPGESLRLFALHTVYFWFPPGADFYTWRKSIAVTAYTVVKSLLTIAALAGWLVAFFLRRKAALYLLPLLVMYPLAYYVVNWSSRYRAPMEWVLVLLAGVFLARLTEKLGFSLFGNKGAWARY